MQSIHICRRPTLNFKLSNLKLKTPPNILKTLTVILTILLTACATFIDYDKSKGARALKNHQWQLTARIGIITKGTQGTQSYSGNIYWQQNKKKYNIEIRGPFGIGTTKITGNKNKINITTPQGNYSSNNPEKMLKQTLGWSIPLHQARYWITARHDPRKPTPQKKHDEKGNLTQQTQPPWQIQYQNHKPTVLGTLPEKIKFTHLHTTIKMVRIKWQLLNP